MSERKTVVPPALEAVYKTWHFAPAVVANGMIHVSGIIGTSPDGEPPAALNEGAALAGAAETAREAEAELSAMQAVRDPEAQFATAFEALEAILMDADAGLEDIVELTSYHVDMAGYMDLFMEVKDRYLGEPYPAWTAVGVSELIVPGGLVELKAVAQVPE